MRTVHRAVSTVQEYVRRGVWSGTGVQRIGIGSWRDQHDGMDAGGQPLGGPDAGPG